MTDMPAIAFIRKQRYDTRDTQTYAAVRRDELAAVLAASDRVVTVQECELDLPEETTRSLATYLAAPLRPVEAVIGDVAGATWISGPLKDQPRPRAWRARNPPVLAPGYRCQYVSEDGYRCDMLGEGLQPCPAHQPGTRWEVLPPLDDEDG